MKKQEEDFKGLKLPGIPMLIFNILALIGIIVLMSWLFNNVESDVWLAVGVIIGLVLFMINTIAWVGFMQIEPNEARVMIFFGKYCGTVKENGFSG